MARSKKSSKRVNIRLATDAYDMLAEYAQERRLEMTFVLEQLIRLFIPALRKKSASKVEEKPKS